jgi:MoxR-like ATPase
MNFLSSEKVGRVTALPSRQGLPERFHEFDEPSVGAVNAALAAQRPLLVRGEPGVGKTQLAEAVATELQRAFYSLTVDARTESRDLLWRFDAVMRLAQAQLCATLNKDPKVIEQELAVQNFVQPGPLWWAFDSTSAQAANHGASPLDQRDNKARLKNGWVVLIDEIDKAESDMPNGLLEALGAGQFVPLGREEPVCIVGEPPLIIVTTNEERVLPDAFVRRCLVLHLALPSTDDAPKLIEYLKKRGRAHFGERTTDEVLHDAAQQLVEDRKFAVEQQLRPLPGQAEYLDLVRAVVTLAQGDVAKQQKLLASAARFTLKKHPSMLATVPET